MIVSVYQSNAVEQATNLVYGRPRKETSHIENVYSVLVYYRDYGERYDRIVGFGKGSSEFITN